MIVLVVGVSQHTPTKCRPKCQSIYSGPRRELYREGSSVCGLPCWQSFFLQTRRNCGVVKVAKSRRNLAPRRLARVTRQPSSTAAVHSQRRGLTASWDCHVADVEVARPAKWGWQSLIHCCEEMTGAVPSGGAGIFQKPLEIPTGKRSYMHPSSRHWHVS